MVFISKIGLTRRTDPVTKIFFLHLGQPKSEFYAKEYKAQYNNLYYDVPPFAEKLVNNTTRVNDRVRRSLELYGKKNESLEGTLTNLCQSVQGSVNEVVPEFGPLQCEPAFLLTDHLLETQLEALVNSDVKRAVFLPLYPHFHAARAGLLLKEVSKFLSTRTVAGPKQGQPASRNLRIVPNNTASFEISALARWSDHPFLTNLWHQKLSSIKDDYDAILFTAPNLRQCNSIYYRYAVWATCERIMAELDFAVPFDLALYNAWDHVDVWQKDGLATKGAKMVGPIHARQRVAVVPVTAFFPTFDTMSILPNITAKIDGLKLVEPPTRPADSKIVVNGLTELIKNHLLGRRHSELNLLSPMWKSKDYESVRALFV